MILCLLGILIYLKSNESLSIKNRQTCSSNEYWFYLFTGPVQCVWTVCMRELQHKYSSNHKLVHFSFAHFYF